MTLRELAQSDLKKTLEDKDGAGTPFTLIDGEAEYPVIGTFGDIAYLLMPDVGNPVRTRTIVATYLIETLRRQTARTPERGWRVRLTDIGGNEQILFVTRYEPDRTIGIAKIIMAAKL
jgi:hypothetical protein